MDSSELAALLQKARMHTVSREITIFSIGGKGYFENPTSDMLAFFFDPHQIHGFKDLLLRSFFACLAEEPPRSMDLVEPPIREQETVEGNRIDLILIGDDWVLSIENKIDHIQDNPFLEYERYLTTRFQGKKIYRAILSPSGRSSEPNWLPVSYKNFVDKIYENLGKLFLRSEFNKWYVFMREFLIHLENYAMEREMEEEKAKFVEDNYQLINQIVGLRDQYHSFLQQKGLAVLMGLFPDGEFTTTIHMWSEGPAIRYFSSNRWKEKINIAIQISHQAGDQGLGVFMYAYGIPNAQTIPSEQIAPDLKSWTEGRDIRCFRTRQRFSAQESLLERFEELAQWFDQFLRTWGIAP